MKHLSAIILSALLLVCSSCVREEVPDNTPEGNFEALWQIVDRNYCFFPLKGEQLGVDWNAVHDEYSRRISPQMTNSQLFEVMADMLSQLHDGHVNLYTSMDVARYWSWYEDYPRNLDVELREQYLGTDYHIGSGLKYRILDDNVGYIVCESFESALGEGNLDDALYYLRSCSKLIVDVRGNSGGLLTSAERLARRFTNERILVGYLQHKTGAAHDAFSSPKAEYLSPSDGVRWQKPCVVLTNRQCYSACNTFVRDMKQCPGVVVLGDRTGGGSGLPTNSELPNGWAVRLSTSPQLDADMQHTEFGIEPDIQCSLDSADVQRGYDTLIEQARRL